MNEKDCTCVECEDSKCWMVWLGEHIRRECHWEEVDHLCPRSHGLEGAVDVGKYSVVNLGKKRFGVIKLDFHRQSLREIGPRVVPLVMGWLFELVDGPMSFQDAVLRREEIEDDAEREEFSRRLAVSETLGVEYTSHPRVSVPRRLARSKKKARA